MYERFTIIGAGGIGTWLAKGIAATLQYRQPGTILNIVDGDIFEERNHERQDFSHIGNKADVVAMDLQQLFPETFCIPHPLWVVAEADENSEELIGVHDLLHEGDVVFCVVDNFATRALVFEAAKAYDNVDVFTGGNSDGLDGGIYHYRRRDGKDVTDHPEIWHEELINPTDRNPGEMSCQERAEIEGGTQLLATNMTVAGLLLGAAHKTIFADGPVTYTECVFDLDQGRAAPYERFPEEIPVTTA